MLVQTRSRARDFTGEIFAGGTPSLLFVPLAADRGRGRFIWRVVTTEAFGHRSMPKTMAHPTEACARSRPQVFGGMAPVSTGLLEKESPTNAGPSGAGSTIGGRSTEISLVKLQLCRA